MRRKNANLNRLDFALKQLQEQTTGGRCVRFRFSGRTHLVPLMPVLKRCRFGVIARLVN